jgi:hypothetical protein
LLLLLLRCSDLELRLLLSDFELRLLREERLLDPSSLDRRLDRLDFSPGLTVGLAVPSLVLLADRVCRDAK